MATTDQGDAFANVFSQFLGIGANIGTKILEQKGESKLAQIKAQEQIDAQKLYTQLANSSPNLGSNAPAAATGQAKLQASLNNGVIAGFSVYALGLIALGVILVVLVVRRIRT